MKFLCDNCKAKYQIADENVACKTVRMKCRKCGHQIEVRAAVTETSVSLSPPTGGADAPRPVAKAGLATSLSAAKPRAPMVATQTQNLGGLAGAFQRTVQDGPQAVSPPTQANNPVELSVTDEWYVAINGVPVGPVRISELRRKAASGAVTDESLCWQGGSRSGAPYGASPSSPRSCARPRRAIVRRSSRPRPTKVAPRARRVRRSGLRARRVPLRPSRVADRSRAMSRLARCSPRGTTSFRCV